MKIQLKPILYFLFITPLFFIWASNVYILDEYNERVMLYWQMSFISVFAGIVYTVISFNKEIGIKQKLFWEYFKPLILLLLVGLFATYLSTSLINFTIKAIFQNILLILFSGLSLFIGLGLSKNDRNFKILKICIISFTIYGFIQFITLSRGESLISILQKRPFTLSFYFPPIFVFYLIYFQPNKTINLIFIPLLIILIFLSGSRSGLFLAIPLILQYLKDYKKLVLLVVLVVIIFFVDYDVLLENEIFANSRVGKFDTARNLIWKNSVNQIVNQESYLIGNGLVRPNFSSNIEEIHSAHNTYFQLYYMYGLIGCIIGISYMIKVLKIFSKFNIIFALAFLVVTLVNDISLFPFDYSRIYEYMFIFFFIGSLLSWNPLKSL